MQGLEMCFQEDILIKHSIAESIDMDLELQKYK